MIELRHNTTITIPVGVLLSKTGNHPVYGALLSWYYWHHIIKSNGVVLDIVSRQWSNISNCEGCYNLTLLNSDVNILGPLTLYINDDTSLKAPIFEAFNVVSQNYYDAKYGILKLAVSVEPFADKG